MPLSLAKLLLSRLPLSIALNRCLRVTRGLRELRSWALLRSYFHQQLVLFSALACPPFAIFVERSFLFFIQFNSMPIYQLPTFKKARDLFPFFPQDIKTRAVVLKAVLPGSPGTLERRAVHLPSQKPGVGPRVCASTSPTGMLDAHLLENHLIRGSAGVLVEKHR